MRRVHPLMDQPGAYEAIVAAIDSGQLEVLFTLVTIDKLAAVSDPDRRARLLSTPFDIGRLVPTGAFALDSSRLDSARVSDDVDVMEALRSGTSSTPATL